jgi:hypothetical protein
MAESKLHGDLVRALMHWMQEKYCSYYGVCFFKDSFDELRATNPPNIGGFVPDVLAEDTPPTFTAIGEAKTPDDIETQHSQAQFAAYLNFLQYRPKPQLVLAVPLIILPTARQILALARSNAKAIYVTITVLPF